MLFKAIGWLLVGYVMFMFCYVVVLSPPLLLKSFCVRCVLFVSCFVVCVLFPFRSFELSCLMCVVCVRVMFAVVLFWGEGVFLCLFLSLLVRVWLVVVVRCGIVCCVCLLVCVTCA